MEEQNKVNAYICEELHITITRNVDPGVTPMFILCPRCMEAGDFKMAGSRMYKVNQQFKHTHEWYRPASKDGLDKYEKEHIEQGGLLLRKVK